SAYLFFFFSSRRRHTRFSRDWSSDVCSSDLAHHHGFTVAMLLPAVLAVAVLPLVVLFAVPPGGGRAAGAARPRPAAASSPYRHATIWRVRGVSMLLGVPQFTVVTYALV